MRILILIVAPELPKTPDQAAAQKLESRPHMRFRLRAQHGSPGTEFLDAETERQKPPPKGTNARRDKNRGIEWQKSPQKRPIWRRLRSAPGLEPGTR